MGYGMKKESALIFTSFRPGGKPGGLIRFLLWVSLSILYFIRREELKKQEQKLELERQKGQPTAKAGGTIKKSGCAQRPVSGQYFA